MADIISSRAYPGSDFELLSQRIATLSPSLCVTVRLCDDKSERSMFLKGRHSSVPSQGSSLSRRFTNHLLAIVYFPLSSPLISSVSFPSQPAFWALLNFSFNDPLNGNDAWHLLKSSLSASNLPLSRSRKDVVLFDDLVRSLVLLSRLCTFLNSTKSING